MNALAASNLPQEAWVSLVVFVVAAAAAFGLGALVRYRRGRIQREYQERMERQRNQPGDKIIDADYRVKD